MNRILGTVVLPVLFTLVALTSNAAIIIVTNTNDAEAGSLRESINIALAGDIIDATGVAGTITLTTGHIDIVSWDWKLHY